MIRRTIDPLTVNALLKRDGVEVDFAEVLEEPMHVCLLDGDSGAIFMWRGPGVYELHLFFAVRGKAAISLLRDMLDMMRLSHTVRMFWAMIPEASRNVRMFARLVGWKSLGLRETKHGPNELFVLEN